MPATTATTTTTTTAHYPQSRFIKSKGFEVHYYEWGTKKPDTKTVVMIHGLTRTGADFIPLADYLHTTKGYHCISFDVIGRGLSSWVTSQEEADKHYNPPFYIELFTPIFTELKLKDDYYIGTSMGGIIGFVGLGSSAFSPYFSKIVLNDIGPYIPMEALRNIGRYTRTMPVYDTAGEVMADLKARMATFGTYTDEQFKAWAVPYVRRMDSGKFTFHYDERMLEVFRRMLSNDDAVEREQTDEDNKKAHDAGEAAVEPASPMTTNKDDAKARAQAEAVWALYDNVKIPILLIRGANSDLLTTQDAKRMIEMKEGNAKMHTVPDCGHAPMLTNAADMTAISDFFTA